MNDQSSSQRRFSGRTMSFLVLCHCMTVLGHVSENWVLPVHDGRVYQTVAERFSTKYKF